MKPALEENHFNYHQRGLVCMADPVVTSMFAIEYRWLHPTVTFASCLGMEVCGMYDILASKLCVTLLSCTHTLLAPLKLCMLRLNSRFDPSVPYSFWQGWKTSPFTISSSGVMPLIGIARPSCPLGLGYPTAL